MKDFIVSRIKEKLNEIEGVTYKYGCVMLDFNIEDGEWDKVQSLVKDEDISELKDEGRETNPHVTVLYGIHGDVPDADVEALIKDLVAPELMLNKISIFEKDDSDVVKFEIKNDSLIAMNKKLKQLPYTSDFDTYEAHATIAFVKHGKGKDYVQTLEGDSVMKLTPSKITYSKANGEKKTYKFKS